MRFAGRVTSMRFLLASSVLVVSACAGRVQEHTDDPPGHTDLPGDSGVDSGTDTGAPGDTRLVAIAEVLDGTIRDVAARHDVVWLAQGRILARLDPVSGARAADHPLSPFPATLVAVEWAAPSGRLLLATDAEVLLLDDVGVLDRWAPPEGAEVTDLALSPDGDRVAVATHDGVVVLSVHADRLGDAIASVGPPPSLFGIQRLALGGPPDRPWVAATGASRSATARGQNGLAVAWPTPGGGPGIWQVEEDPPTGGTWRGLAVLHEPDAPRLAATAGGVGLVVWDLSSPPGDPTQVTFPGASAPLNVVHDPVGRRLLVATWEHVHALDDTTFAVLGAVHSASLDGGERDMVLATHGERRGLWMGLHGSAVHNVVGVDVSADTLRVGHRIPWISSSDGMVVHPGWRRGWLPTFGGVLPYDLTDVEQPIALPDAYRPAGGTVEHVHLVPIDDERALLVTAPGTFGVRWFEVRRDDPRPAVPEFLGVLPTGMLGGYNNDVGSYVDAEGGLHLLSSYGATASILALQTYDLAAGRVHDVLTTSPDLTGFPIAITVHGDVAFASGKGGFFVVDLSPLPHAPPRLLAEEIVRTDGRPTPTSGIAVSPDGRRVYVTTDGPGGLVAYAFDPTGEGPLLERLGALSGIEGCTSRARHHPWDDRVLVATRGGEIADVDVSDPRAPRLRQRWRSEVYRGEMQDVHPVVMDGRLLWFAVKNNEAFAILEDRE